MATEKVLTLGASGIVEKVITVAADDVAIKQSISLTAGQTAVVIPGGYEVSGLFLFLNGVYLSPAEYTATNGTSVVLAVGAPSTGSILDVINFLSSGVLALGTAALRNAIGLLPLYGRDSILGAVTESSGIPTGAIIERGSNANGNYVKYADGTLICTHIVSLGSWAANASTTAVWTYPATYAFTPIAVCNDTTGAPHAYNSSCIASGSSATIYMGGIFGGAAASVNIMAIGRWY